MNLLTAVVVLGALGIVRARVRYNGLIAGIIFSIFPIMMLIAASLVLLAFGVLVNKAAYDFSDEGEKAQEAWRREQIALTGADPCADLYANERERRHTQELIDSGAIDDGDALVTMISSDPYAGISFEEAEAAREHAFDMWEKCPPLDYVDAQQ